MEIHAYCEYNLKSFKALNGLMLFGKENPAKRMLMWGIIYGILLVAVILNLFWLGPDSTMLLLLCLLVVIQLYMCSCYFLRPIRQYKSMANLRGAVNHYCFRQDSLEVTSSNSSYNGQSELQYSGIFRCMETDAYFFLFLSKRQVYAVDKATITGGTAEDIRNRLSACLGRKYIRCKY